MSTTAAASRNHVDCVRLSDAGATIGVLAISARICGHRSRSGVTSSGSEASAWSSGSRPDLVDSFIAHLRQTHPLAQQAAAAMQLRFARADRDAEHSGNLFMAVAVHRLQHDHMPRARRQRRQRALDVYHFARVVCAVRLHWHVLRVFHGFTIGLRARAVIALVREHLVDGDTVQPRAEGAAALEGRETPPGTYESLLHAILRHVAPAHD